MENDALDLAVARHARQAGMITAEQLSTALAEQAKRSQAGSPVSLADALHQLGYLTDAQRRMVEEKARGKKDSVQQLLHYKLVRKIGEGGMGAVYLAEDSRSGRKVALKVLPKHLSTNVELVKRFKREAQAAIRLDHPNIVRGFEVGEDLGFHFYAMEYCEGQPLDRLLAVENRLPVDRALGLALQVARGLEFAHRSGLIHRDIKPANIFLVQGGPAKILDLGLSKNLEGSQSTFHTVTGAVMGTPHYISPEQANSEKTIDGRTDLYSLGATLYHMLTGEAPFPGSSAMEVMYKHVHDQLPDPREKVEDLPERVVELLKRMMAKAPADRHADAARLIEDLEEVIAGRSPKSASIDPGKTTIAPLRVAAARPAGPTGTGRIKKVSTVRRSVVIQRRSNAPIVAGIAAAAVAVIGVFALWPKGKPEPAPPPPPAVRRAAPTPPGPPPETPKGTTETWIASVASLPSHTQIEAVRAKLRELNAAFDGRMSHQVEQGKIVELKLEGADVADLSPLRALPSIRRLILTRSKVADLSPLRPLALDALFIDYTSVADLSPLEKMPLRLLNIGNTPVSSLEPLRAAPLEWIVISGTQVQDLSPLRGKRMGGVLLHFSKVSSLEPLRGMPLKQLYCGDARVVDLEPIRGMPIEELTLTYVPSRDRETLLSLKSLKTVNQLPVADFWKKHEAPSPAGVPRDLLPLVEPERDSLRGVWKREGGALVSDKTQPARLQVAYEPPEEYDLRVDFTRVNGACATLIFAARAGRTFGVTLGDVGNTLGGFSRIGDLPVDKAPNSVKLGLSDGRRYAALVEVRRERVTIKLDGASLVEWRPALGELLRPDEWNVRQEGLLGLGSCDAATTFHKVEVVEMSGPGKEIPAPARPVSLVPSLKPRAVLEAPSACQIAWSPDGRTIAGGGDSGELVFWDAAAGMESSRRPAHPKGVASVAFSPDGKWLATSGREDRTLRRWATDGKSAPRLLATHGTELSEIAVSPDGARIAGACREEVGIWDAATGKAVRIIPLPAEGSGTVAWAPSGKRLATGSWRKQVRILDPETGALLKTFSGHAEGVVCVRWSPDGKVVASSSRDGSLRAWDAETGALLWKADSHESNAVRALVFTPDGKRLISGGFDSKARVWEAATGVEEYVLDGHGNFSVGLAASPDGKRVASAGANPEVLVWDLPAAADRPWRPLFDGKSLAWLISDGDGGWRVDRGALVRAPGSKVAAQTVETVSDGEFRIRFEVAAETEYVGFAVRQSEAGREAVGVDRKGISSIAGQACEILILCAGPAVRATLNGKPMTVTRSGTPRSGHLQITTVGIGLRILAVDYRPPATAPAAEEQARAVVRKLRELNPKLEGGPSWEVQNGQVVSFTLLTVNVTDLSPLKALTGLRRLRATGSWVEATGEYKAGGLVSLESLRGMELTELEVNMNALTDLSPLRGMKLERLALASNPVKSLAPLSGMPLKTLDIGGTPVSDLRPLEGMKLEALLAWDSPIEDLAPLQGMPMSVINVRKTRVRSVEALRGMPLAWISLHDCPVKDLTPLRNMRLGEYYGPVDRDVARTWKFIEKINDKPAADMLGGGAWRPIFDGKTMDWMDPETRTFWRIENGMLVCLDPSGNSPAQSLQDMPDGELRVRFDHQSLAFLSFSARAGVEGRYRLDFGKESLKTMEGREHELVLDCRGASVKAFLDGQAVEFTEASPSKAGRFKLFSNGGRLRVKAIEHRP